MAEPQPPPIAAMRPIGVVRVPESHDTVIQARYAPVARGVVELETGVLDALDGLEGFDFAWIVTLLDRAADPRDDPSGEALRPVPFLLAEHGTHVGVFASRYPHRPNRIGLSLVRLESIEPPNVYFSGVDLFDETPVLDIKPWISDFDLPPGARPAPGIRCGWFDTLETRPVTLDDAESLVLVARQLAGRSALVARTLALDGLGTTDAGEIALLDPNGVRAGRILGGALDGALTALAGQLLGSDAEATRASLVDLEIDDASAIAAGLSCGGHASVVLQPIDHVPSGWWTALAQRRPVALITALDAPNMGSVVIDDTREGSAIDTDVITRASELLERGRSRSVLEKSDDGRLLIEVTLPIPRLFVIGSAALAGDIVHLAGWLGWAAEQFADADLAAAALDSLGHRDALVVLDHALQRTGPLLAAALQGSVGYVGALGSRRTQQRRVDHLRGLGVDDDALARLHGPTGLDLGSANRAEIAMSICAEITATRAKRTSRSLRDLNGPIMS